MPKINTTWFATYHLHYKKKLKMTKFVYNFSLFWPLPKLILLLYTLSNYIIKIIKLLYYILKVGNYLFAIYHLYYKKKLEMIKSVYDFCLHYKPDKFEITTLVY